MGSEITFCTVASANYLPGAVVLAASLRRAGVEEPLWVLLADQDDARPHRRDDLRLLTVQEVGADAFLCPRRRFKYTATEFCTALKPHILRHLLAAGHERVVFLDADTRVEGSVPSFDEALEEFSIVLTPHLIRPSSGGPSAWELDILLSGSINTGFVGLRKSPAAMAFAEWWCDRLTDHCLLAKPHGVFIDQRWMDLVTGLFPCVHVCRRPGWNVGVWNLDERLLSNEDGTLRVNGEPLVFYHYSPARLPGSAPEESDPEIVRQLWASYRSECQAAASDVTDYAYGHFSNGVAIPDAARRLYREVCVAGRAEAFGDPFEVEAGPGQTSFYQWLGGVPPRSAGVSRLLLYLHETDSYLRSLFPDVLGADRAAYLSWVRQYGATRRLSEPWLPRGGRSHPMGLAGGLLGRRGGRALNRLETELMAGEILSLPLSGGSFGEVVPLTAPLLAEALDRMSLVPRQPVETEPDYHPLASLKRLLKSVGRG